MKSLVCNDLEVRGILSGAKTQIRRVAKLNLAGRVELGGRNWHCDDPNARLACPYGQPGDRLCLKEIWMPGYYHDPDHDNAPQVGLIYKADLAELTKPAPSYELAEQWDAQFSDDGDEPPHWRSPVCMPRWASRITLELTEVRAQRLQDITWDDAVAEGHQGYRPTQDEPAHQFQRLWDSAHAWRGPWASNPLVFALTFRRVDA